MADTGGASFRLGLGLRCLWEPRPCIIAPGLVMLLVSFVVAGLGIGLLVLALSRSGRAGKIAA